MDAYDAHVVHHATTATATPPPPASSSAYDTSIPSAPLVPPATVAVPGYGTHGYNVTNHTDGSNTIVDGYNIRNVPSLDSYNSYCSSMASSSYGGYSAAASSAVDSGDADTPYATRVGYTSRTPAESHALMRQWEVENVFRWASNRLVHAAKVVMGTQREDIGKTSHPSSSTSLSPSSSSSSSSSYRWRSLRWSYLQSYPSTSWNSFYQRLFESVAVSNFSRSEKTRQQSELLEQFIQFARNTVELIMEEVHLPPEDQNTKVDDPQHYHTKFLSPLAVGGVAGGEKFILNGILFKFARDWAGLFGSVVNGGVAPAGVDRDVSSDEFVQKSAANEIRHMNGLIEHDGNMLIEAPLFLTMSCLFRIRGSVVMCTALAPIQGEESLIYGSSDAGATIQFDSASSTASMAYELATRWNLAPHPVSDSNGTRHALPLATDIEVHGSKVDGRMYMLDLARFLPPTPPTPRTMEHLYFMFRPEFMREHVFGSYMLENHPNPPTLAEFGLSADAFSGFGNIDSMKWNGRCEMNFRHLKYVNVPRTAECLQQWFDREFVAHPNDNTSTTSSFINTDQTKRLSTRISHILHGEGVNVRYLALVRAITIAANPSTPSSPSPSVRFSLSTLLLCDMVSRTLKQLYLGWVRRMMLSVGRMVDAKTIELSQQQQYQDQPDQPPSTAHAGWTEVDLDRWMRRMNGEVPRAADVADGLPNDTVSTCHHESSLLFSRLLQLLFSTTFESDTFWKEIVWTSLQHKFVKMITWGGQDFIRYQQERTKVGMEELSQHESDRIRSIDTFISKVDMDEFRKECRNFFHDTSSPPTTSSSNNSFVPIFVTLLFESIGFDFLNVRHSLDSRFQGMTHDLTTTPVQFVRHLLKQLDKLDQHQQQQQHQHQHPHDITNENRIELSPVVSNTTTTTLTIPSSSDVEPLTMLTVFMLSFTTHVKHVRPLPFITLSESERSLRSTISRRIERVGTNHVTLIGALFALLEIYQAQKDDVDQHDEENVASNRIDNQESVESSTTTPVASLTPYEKGVQVLQQIEKIFEKIITSESESMHRSLVTYNKFGWFYLKFGRLKDAKTYFEKDYIIRLEEVERIEKQSNDAMTTTTTAPPSSSPSSSSSVHSPLLLNGLLALAASLESLGIIERELGDGHRSLNMFQACLETYQKVYGTRGIGLASAVTEAKKGDQIHQEDGDIEDNDDDDDDGDSPRRTFRSSITLATLYTNLANSYGVCGDSNSKRRYLEGALEIMRSHHHAVDDNDDDDDDDTRDKSLPHPNTITIQLNLSTCLTTHASATKDELDRAKVMLEQCVEWTKALYATTTTDSTTVTTATTTAPTPPAVFEHHSLASIYSALASCVGKLGDSHRQVELLQSSFKIVTNHFGEIHPEVAIIQTNLGIALGRIGQPLQGLKMLQAALNQKTKIYGTPIHQEVGITLSNMAVLYGQLGDWKQEFRSLQQALQIFVTAMQKQAAEAKAAALAAAAAAAASTGVNTAGTPMSAVVSTPPPTTAASLASNPHLLYTQQRFFRAKQAMAAREKETFEKGCCSFLATGTNRTIQTWWTCLTCSPNVKSNLGLCAICVERCHVGHQLVKQEPTPFYCDCGEGVFTKPCQALEPTSKEEKEKNDKDEETTTTTKNGESEIPMNKPPTEANGGTNTSVSVTASPNVIAPTVVPPSPAPASVDAAPSATHSSSSSSSSPSPPSFDLAGCTSFWSELFVAIQTTFRSHRIHASYIRDFMKDILFLIHGIRPTFIVDRFASLQGWTEVAKAIMKVIRRQKSNSSDSTATAPSSPSVSIGVLDLCEEGVLFFNRHALQIKLTHDLPCLTDESHPTPIEWINVDPSFKEPQLLNSEQRSTLQQHLARVIKELIQQLEQAKDESTPLVLPPMTADDDEGDDGDVVSLPSSIRSISLTTLCGYLLDYPIIYCTPPSGSASSSSSSSIHGNNLSMKPLLRYVHTIRLRNEFETKINLEMRDRFKFLMNDGGGADDDTNIFVCSFTVPSSLVNESSNIHVAMSLSRWSHLRSHAADARIKSINHLHTINAFDQQQSTVHTENVTLPIVAL